MCYSLFVGLFYLYQKFFLYLFLAVFMFCLWFTFEMLHILILFTFEVSFSWHIELWCSNPDSNRARISSQFPSYVLSFLYFQFSSCKNTIDKYLCR